MGARILGSSPGLFTKRLGAGRHGGLAKARSPSIPHLPTSGANVRFGSDAIHPIDDPFTVLVITTSVPPPLDVAAIFGNDFACLVSTFIGTRLDKSAKGSDASQGGHYMVLYLSTKSKPKGSLGRNWTSGTLYSRLLFAKMVSTTNLCGPS